MPVTSCLTEPSCGCTIGHTPNGARHYMTNRYPLAKWNGLYVRVVGVHSTNGSAQVIVLHPNRALADVKTVPVADLVYGASLSHRPTANYTVVLRHPSGDKHSEHGYKTARGARAGAARRYAALSRQCKQAGWSVVVCRPDGTTQAWGNT